MRYPKTYALGVVAVIALVLIDIIFLKTAQVDGTQTGFVDQRLKECGAYPNGSTQTVTETSRTFVNLPKDLYPNVNLGVTAHGASVGVVSNGGRYGYAMGADQKPNCWSYYFEFNGMGTVDLSSQGASSTVPDYVVHFVVTKT